jgi:hypothetical protein
MAVLSIVLERLDVGRDMAVVEICWGLEEEERGDIILGIDILTFKREAIDDEATDFPAVLCDRAELAEDRDLALILEVNPVKKDRVDHEVTLAKDAREINNLFDTLLRLVVHLHFHFHRHILPLLPPLLPSDLLPIPQVQESKEKLTR